jgi:hypothetical protein
MFHRPLQQSVRKVEIRADQIATVNASHEPRPLFETVKRMKARWLKRVMYETTASSTAKCLAYAISDHLNCVTLDCWPGQLRLTQLLGRKSTKTPTRTARELEELGLLTLKRDHRNRLRYAPVFVPVDQNNSDAAVANICPASADKNGGESFLPNPSNLSASKGESSEGRVCDRELSKYNPRQRGAIEIQIAALLGRDGMGILGRLGWYDDAIVDRLCRAYAEGTLGERELAAARLAGEQM